MTSVASPPSERRSTDRPSHRRRWRVLLLVLLGLAVIAAAAAWLAVGLLGAAKDVKARAESTQSSLEAFKTALTAGDQEAATAQLSAARTSLASAREAADRPQVRVASHLPVASTAVGDLDHLLAAAGYVVDAGSRVQAIYGSFSGPDSTLFHDSEFDLPALQSAAKAAAEIDALMGRAQNDLSAVKGTVPGTSAVLDARNRAQAQVTELRGQIADLRPVLAALPAAVGADTPRTYMVALLNPGEMRGSGGAPLSGVVLRFEKGKMDAVQQGAVASITADETGLDNQIVGWNWTSKNPYRPNQRFANSNQNPDFPVSGEEMVRSWKANFPKVTLNGVIAMDMKALSQLLTVTGPIQSSAYGQVTADNLVQVLLVDSYRQFAGNNPARRAANDEVMTAMMSKLTEGGGLLGKARALGQAVPGRHLQAYFVDPALEALVVDKGLAGALVKAPVGDYVAGYTINSNGSKVDIYQQRVVTVAAAVRPDGGADVTQTMKITNAVPDGPGDPSGLHTGYLTRWAGAFAYLYVPPKATDVAVSGAGEPQRTVSDVDGRTIVRRRSIEIAPGETVQVTLKYRLPAGTFTSGSSLTYRLTSEPSNLLNTPTLRIRVTAPTGFTIAGGGDWKVRDQHASLDVPMDKLRTTTLEMTH